jgi:SAM-dependent methyltransferase
LEIEQTAERLEERESYYAAQAGWTRATRSYLYRRTGLTRAARILEVGCGTGEITQELARRTKARITAVDVDDSMVEHVRERVPSAEMVSADAACLEFPDGSFDAAVCHFTLMWCAEPGAVVREMARVVRKSGHIVALSEPDYGGAIEYPNCAGHLRLIGEGLRNRGADPEIGRKLGHLFSQASLETQTGLASTVWTGEAAQSSLEAGYWLLKDVAGEQEQVRVRNAHSEAVSAGGFVLFLPVFWACGLKT